MYSHDPITRIHLKGGSGAIGLLLCLLWPTRTMPQKYIIVRLGLMEETGI